MAEKQTPSSGPERSASRTGDQDRPASSSSRTDHARGDRMHDFADRIVQDPAQVPAVWLLTGYLGQAAQPDRRRLYLSPDLSQWIEMPEDALLHTAPVPGDWLGAVVAWVRQDAQLVAGNRWSGQPQR